MERVIWKFPLGVIDEQVIALPRGAKILSVQLQGETPCIWAYVDPDAQTEVLHVTTVGTGHPADHVKAEDHIGTYYFPRLGFVGHVFAWKA